MFAMGRKRKLGRSIETGQFGRELSGLDVSVAEEHPNVLVAADAGQLGRVET